MPEEGPSGPKRCCQVMNVVCQWDLDHLHFGDSFIVNRQLLTHNTLMAGMYYLCQCYRDMYHNAQPHHLRYTCMTVC